MTSVATLLESTGPRAWSAHEPLMYMCHVSWDFGGSAFASLVLLVTGQTDDALHNTYMSRFCTVFIIVLVQCIAHTMCKHYACVRVNMFGYRARGHKLKLLVGWLRLKYKVNYIYTATLSDLFEVFWLVGGHVRDWNSPWSRTVSKRCHSNRVSKANTSSARSLAAEVHRCAAASELNKVQFPDANIAVNWRMIVTHSPVMIIVMTRSVHPLWHQAYAKVSDSCQRRKVSHKRFDAPIQDVFLCPKEWLQFKNWMDASSQFENCSHPLGHPKPATASWPGSQKPCVSVKVAFEDKPLRPFTFDSSFIYTPRFTHAQLDETLTNSLSQGTNWLQASRQRFKCSPRPILRDLVRRLINCFVQHIYVLFRLTALHKALSTCACEAL